MLLSKRGARGLDLSTTTHIIICDAIWNRSTYVQVRRGLLGGDS